MDSPNLGNFRGEGSKTHGSSWQLKSFSMFTRIPGEMIQFDGCIFFRWVESKPPTRKPWFRLLDKKTLEPETNLETPKVRSWSHWWDESHSGEGTGGPTWKPGCGMPKPGNTVDGSEIRRSPVEGTVVEIPLFTGFFYIQKVVSRISSINSSGNIRIILLLRDL